MKSNLAIAIAGRAVRRCLDFGFKALARFVIWFVFFPNLIYLLLIQKMVITAKHNMVMIVKHELQSAYTIIPICNKKIQNCVLAVLRKDMSSVVWNASSMQSLPSVIRTT